MDTSGISGSSGTSGTNNEALQQATSASSTFGATDFLSLLVTQLAYQDPLAPMDNFQFTQQLVSLASLEQLASIASNTSTGTGSTPTGDSTSLAQAASFIGLDVTLATNQVTVTDGTAGSVDVRIDEPAASVKVELVAADGSVARSVSLGPTAAGATAVSFDDASSAALANGSYTVKVTALGADGEPVATSVEAHGTITAVSERNGQIYVEVNGREVRLDELVRIAAPASSTASG
ncbi:MAG: flagellar hook capping FlgD N-terminal domain-containing protein [bacterium]